MNLVCDSDLLPGVPVCHGLHPQTRCSNLRRHVLGLLCVAVPRFIHPFSRLVAAREYHVGLLASYGLFVRVVIPPVQLRVRPVLFFGTPFEVFHAVVMFVAVDVVHLRVLFLLCKVDVLQSKLDGLDGKIILKN